MKGKIIFLLVSFGIYSQCCCQPPTVGSREYTMAIYKNLSDLKDEVAQIYKDSFSIRRIETGILEKQGSQLSGSTTRRLLSGNAYAVIAFTDSRVSDFNLTVSKEAEGNKWNIIKVQDSNSATSSSNLIGDFELLPIIPDTDGSYKFEISSKSPITSNTSARYGILLFSREITASTALIYNIDNYITCEWNRKKGKYGGWSSPTTYPCSFEINVEETIIKWKNANSVTTFYITDKDTSLDTWTNYTIRSSSNGDRYIFMTPKPKSSRQYVRMSKLDGNPHNSLTDYHIQPPSSRTNTTAKVTYSVDNYLIASYNSQKKDYGEFVNETKFSCLFEVDADKKKITWRQSSGTVTTFDITGKDDSDNKWLYYTIKSQIGDHFTFGIPKNDYKYIKVVKLDGKEQNPLRVYHITNEWSD